jgi:hypothetical protein
MLIVRPATESVKDESGFALRRRHLDEESTSAEMIGQWHQRLPGIIEGLPQQKVTKGQAGRARQVGQAGQAGPSQLTTRGWRRTGPPRRRGELAKGERQIAKGKSQTGQKANRKR